MPSFFLPSLMPAVPLFIDPLSMEPLSMLPLVIPGLVMLSCCAAGRDVPCANSEPHMRVSAVAVKIVGRMLDKGLGGDEMGERVRLVIDGVDGRVHHIEMDATCAEEVGRGMIVVAGPGPRAADRNIIDVAGEGGVYRPSQHLERARAAIDRIGGDPEAFVRSLVRRLEALRRAGHAERIDADHWCVPPIFPHAVKLRSCAGPCEYSNKRTV
jgi:hypothetical protein